MVAAFYEATDPIGQATYIAVNYYPEDGIDLVVESLTLASGWQVFPTTVTGTAIDPDTGNLSFTWDSGPEGWGSTDFVVTPGQVLLTMFHGDMAVMDAVPPFNVPHNMYGLQLYAPPMPTPPSN